MLKQPKITVYMPTHNREVMLQRAVDSVLAQEWNNWELVIVDDGSGDNTWQLLQKLSQQFPGKIVALRHDTPKGACAARNTAIKAATGDFITGLDDDDEFLPGHLSNLMAHWNPAYACVVASMQNDTGHCRVKQGKEYGTISLSQLLHYNRLGNQVLTLTERLRAIGGFDEQLPAFQDYDCWVRLLAAYGDAKKLRQHTYVLHTAHELGRISNNNSKRLQALSLFKDKHKSKFKRSHLGSMALLEKRIQGQPISLLDACNWLHPQNFRAVISAFIASLRSSKEVKQ